MEKESADGDFWNDPEHARTQLKKLSLLKDTVSSVENLEQQLSDIHDFLEMVSEDDEEYSEVMDMVRDMARNLDQLEFRSMMNKPNDSRNAILSINSGAGGTESMDWAGMLFRMYRSWCESHGFKAIVIDEQPGEIAGIKSVTMEVTGDYAYGFLRSEIGVHRLVRISPFDSNARRHTSFAALLLYPEIESSVEVEINPGDLRIDTYRASGAGGQHVNKTDSAIRITHNPTGIVVQCQSDRSQHRNKDNAMKLLQSKLYQRKLEEEIAKREKLVGEKSENAWGSQIRSYVLHPYNMVKDHRTGVETSNTTAVLDGDLDPFIEAYLLGKQK